MVFETCSIRLARIDDRHNCGQSRTRKEREMGRKWRKARNQASRFRIRRANLQHYQTSNIQSRRHHPITHPRPAARALHSFTLSLSRGSATQESCPPSYRREVNGSFFGASVALLPWVYLPESLRLEQIPLAGHPYASPSVSSPWRG